MCQVLRCNNHQTDCLWGIYFTAQGGILDAYIVHK